MATRTTGGTREIEGRDSVGLYLDEIARNDLLDAAAEVCRRAVVLRGKGSLGWTRTTLSGMAASLARTELARLGLAPASPLALEAICARVVHDSESALGRLAPIADRPGLPRALSRTIGELRLARLDDLEDEHLARLLAAYEKELAAAQLADRAQTLALAAKLAKADGAICFIDVPLEHAAEAMRAVLARGVRGRVAVTM